MFHRPWTILEENSSLKIEPSIYLFSQVFQRALKMQLKQDKGDKEI
jgi:hypothetical protein